MDPDPLLDRARHVWLRMAGVPVRFPPDGGVEVVVSARSLLCPPGWVGIVTVGGAAVVTAPDGDTAELIRRGLPGAPVGGLTDPDRLCAALPVADALGPASLAYTDRHRFRPAGPDRVEVLPRDHADLTALLTSVTADDAEECGLADITSHAFVVRRENQVVAAAGYRRWPGEAAHLCVLTRPDQRGRGLARAVASRAVADGLTRRLLPQWRARPGPSPRVARALGFRVLGGQLSVRLGCGRPLL